MSALRYPVVIPVAACAGIDSAGIQCRSGQGRWVPAYAGTTKE
jgi:hypothetical protein